MIPPGVTFRTRELFKSEMYRFPSESTATAQGLNSSALVAGPPSPKNPAVPLPATVVMIPLAPTFRTLLLPGSAIYKFPLASTATLCGNDSPALVAAPLSPEYPGKPLPATVVIYVFAPWLQPILVQSM